MPAKLLHIKPGELEDLYNRLLLFAMKLAAKQLRQGQRPEPADLVHDVLLRYLQSKRRLGWKRGKGSLFAFLCGVMVNIAREHKRKHSRFIASLSNPATLAEACQNPALCVNPQPKLDAKSELEIVVRASETDDELNAFVRAAGSVDGPFRVQRIAQELGVSPAEVRALQKRLERKLRGLR
jgi:RNA polymerase sigma factor (sigma-70 family)